MNEEQRPEQRPERRKNIADLEKRLDTHVARVEKRLGGLVKKALVAFAVIGLCSAIALVGFSIALGKIQDARREFVEASCNDQNRRHDKTIVELRKAQAEAIKRTPQMAKQIRGSAQSSISIIDALAPKRDCKLLGEIAVGDKKLLPPPPTPKVNRHIKEHP